MRKGLCTLLAVCCLGAALAAPASALEYTVPAPEDYLFGTPTSDDTVYVGMEEQVNTDRSKAAAYIPPAFGSPTSYTLNAGERLTPNLVRQPETATAANPSTGGVTVMPPSYADTSGGNSTAAGDRYTEVTEALYYSGGHLGTLKIPAIGLSVKVYQGTDSKTLVKGAGHFEDTSLWDGNCCIAAHNRGVNAHFGKIHTLDVGDAITWTTKLGTRTYEVCSVAKIAVDDVSVLKSSGENIITLVTCVMDQPDYRWCVTAVSIE